MTLYLLVLGLLGCIGKGGTESLPTLVPTLAIVITEEPFNATPLAASTVIAPTMPVQPSVTPCQLPTQPALTAAWNIEELGCPITPGAAAINTAYAPFEGGQMLWRGDTDTIYVLYNDGMWDSYPNKWREGGPAYTCDEEDNPFTPIRGFGRVWCDYPDVGEALGAARTASFTTTWS